MPSEIGRLCGRLVGCLVVVVVGWALWAPVSWAADPVIAAAGDMACGSNSTGGSCHERQTSDLLVAMPQLDAVLALGDVQYECGELANFNRFYDPTWGRVKSKTRPVVGNHEYRVPEPSNECLSQGEGAPGYFSYFGLASPLDPGCTSGCRGYYSYDLGSWHLIALNSNCSKVGGCGPVKPAASCSTRSPGRTPCRGWARATPSN